MKVVFIGGGSYRTLPVVRAAMAYPKIFHGGEIRLVDFNLDRVATVARMIMKTPEYAGSDCKITWTNKLEKALPGADLVTVSFPVGGFKTGCLSGQACLKHGLFGSDQISLTGAFCSITGGGIFLDIARKMEKHCPKAWLVHYANPVAVYSGLVNNHTKIRALGICGGFANHRWDLSRLLLNRDEYCEDFKVSSAGVNHLAFIVRGTYRGKDIYQMLDERLAGGLKPLRLPSIKRASMRESIHYSMARFLEMHKRFRSIIFSTEGDGMMHIFFEEMRAKMLKHYKPKTALQIDRLMRDSAARRARMDADFKSKLGVDLSPAFWAEDWIRNPLFAAYPGEATVKILKALGGVSREWLAASRPNGGAVRGFKDRTVLEYSMHLDKNGVHPEPDLEVPDVFQGLISSLATHQTLLGDAVASNDPKIFAEALFAYPVQQNTRQVKALWRELLKIHAAEMPGEFQRAAEYF